MKTKFVTLLVIVVLFGPFFLLANNEKRPLPVSSSPSLSTNPGAERAPSRESCPFELYYCEETNTLDILFLEEVDFLSYCTKDKNGMILESASLGSFIEGECYSLSLGVFSSEQYKVELTCNCGSFEAMF